MSGEVTVSSTTDTQEAVNAAAESGGDKLVERREDSAEGRETPINIAEVGHGGVASTTDSPEEVEKVAEDLREEKRERTEEYVGKTRRRLFQRVERQEAVIERQRAEIAALRQGRQPEPQAAQPGNGAQQQQPPQLTQADYEEYRRAQATLPFRFELARQKYPDLQETFEKAARENPISPLTETALVMMPNGHDVGYYLAKHPEHVQDLWAAENAGRGDLVIRKLNWISAGLDFNRTQSPGPAQPEIRSKTQAPAPISPVNSGSSRSGPRLDDPNLPVRDFIRIRNEQERGRGGR
jgi:hypothetical protein